MRNVSSSGALVIAAVVLGISYAGGAVGLGTPPTATDPSADVLSWFQQHQGGARTYAWATTVGLVAFAVLAGIIRGRLPRPMNDIFLLGAAAFLVETAISAWFWAARHSAVEPATVILPRES